MKKYVCDLHTAQERVLAHCRALDITEVAVDKAYGFVLAEDITAQINVPAFDKSPLDGYAFYAEDTTDASDSNPVRLTVIAEVAAGGYYDKKLERGMAVHILTGAPLPAGANAVSRFEDTEEETGFVTLFRSFKANENVVKCGEDTVRGELLARKGTKIDAALLALIASQGIAAVRVYKQPMIGIISQGDEITEPGSMLGKGKIYNSNRFLLAASLAKEGINSIYLGKVNDNPREIAELLRAAVNMYDAVIMTGGVSVGTYDFTQEALENAGAHVLADRVKIKPGSSCCLAVLNGVPVFGLSGNPSAAMTTFHLVAFPAIRKIAGMSDVLPKRFRVVLGADFGKASKNMRILKGSLRIEDGKAVFMPSTKQSNGSVSSLHHVDVYAAIPAGSGPVAKGTKLEAFFV